MTLKINGKLLNYKSLGQDTPFLLVHGWGGSSKSLEPLAKLLSSQYKAITIDLPGFGKSDNPDSDWGIDEYAKALVEFIDKLKLKPVFFFGHSFGGALGLFLAVNYPDYIKKLIICGASYKRNLPKTAKISRFFSWLPSTLKKTIYKIIFPQSDLYKVTLLEKNFRKIVGQDLTPILPKVKLPTFILWGSEDKETPLSHAHELNKKIKNSKLKIFPQIGHNLPLIHPQAVEEEIIKFI